MWGKWVVVLIFGVAAAMSAILLFIHRDRDHYRAKVLAAIEKKFEQKKGEILVLPEVLAASSDFSQYFSQPWSFHFAGDELWILIPFEAPESGESLALARDEAISAWFRSWLHKQDSDAKRFPIRIRWQ